MRERTVTLEFVGGPRDGEEAPLGAPVEIVRGWHRYVLTKDDTGAVFYEYRGRVESLDLPHAA